MRQIKTTTSILIFSSIFISFCNYAVAVEDYVGVKEDDVYIWENTYDDDVMEDYYEDWIDYLEKYVWDYGVNFGAAVEISAGLYESQSIGSNSIKWYKISVEADQNLTVQIDHSSSVDFYLHVYDSNENRVGYYKWYQYGKKNIIHTTYTGYYYISFELDDDGPEYYDLQINVTDWNGDYYEPNDDFLHPYKIYSGLNDEDLECSYGNEDYFYFNFSSGPGYPITIIIEFNNTEGNLDLYLYNETYDLVDYSNATGVHSEVISNITDSSEYFYIMVNNTDSWSNYNNHSYELTFCLSSYCSSSGGSGGFPYFDIEDMVEDITEIEGIKVVVDEVWKEKNDRVKIKYSEYESKDITDDDKWKSEDDDSIWLYDPSKDKCYEESGLTYFLPKGLDWDELADELEVFFEDDYYKCDIETTVNFLGNGLTVLYEFDVSDMDNLEHYCEYDANGVRILAISKYNGKEFMRMALRGYIPPYIILIFIGGVVIGVIAIVTVLIIRKRKF